MASRTKYTSPNTNSARVIKVVETNMVRGKGTEADPQRSVRQYWSFDGMLLAEYDPQEGRM